APCSHWRRARCGRCAPRPSRTGRTPRARRQVSRRVAQSSFSQEYHKQTNWFVCYGGSRMGRRHEGDAVMATTLDRAIATMPRGGPDAAWLDRRFETDALEYLDRDDVADEVKQKVIGMLDRIGTLTNQHENYARAALSVVADIPNPRILELGAGHG